MKQFKFNSIVVILIVFITFSCSNNSEELQDTITQLTTDNEKLEGFVTELQNDLNMAATMYDSLNGVHQSYLEASKTKKAPSQGEKELIELVKSLNTAFNNILVTKDANTILGHFYETFTSNVVMVSLYDVINVRGGNNITYPEQLEHILINNDKIKYLHVSLKEVLHNEVRNNELGIIYFVDDLTVLNNENEKITARVLIQIVAKKYEGVWKIGNYTSVNMADMEEKI